ncbi:SurA N-terminal domain-containing protein [Kitasatospora sp. NPDC051853]|uniref:SurA N-terminal domain-containing protein n=1 Tax=Kitasatospora sp. NPDC051853 TaxID=3364058 RepID=UPI0037A826EF
MIRHLRTTAGVLLAGAALAACGSQPPHQGSAAVVGGERISIAAVEARVGEVRQGVAAETGGQQAERAGLVRRTVVDLVLDRVVAQALVDRQLTVTDGEIAEAKESQARMMGGEAELARELLVRQNVPADAVDSFYRQQLGIQKLAAGKDPRTPEGDAAIRSALTDAGAKLKIEVNPRYGRWDVQQIGLVTAPADWIKQPAATA